MLINISWLSGYVVHTQQSHAALSSLLRYLVNIAVQDSFQVIITYICMLFSFNDVNINFKQFFEVEIGISKGYK